MNVESLIRLAGYASIEEYIRKRVLPVVLISVAAFFITLVTLKLLDFYWYASFLVLFCGIAYLPITLQMVKEQNKSNIQQNIHLFITYVGAVSSLDMSRLKLFREASKKKEYGEITKTIGKIVYLAKDWGLGFAKACRIISTFQASRIFAEFLDRLAAALDFGEPLDVFFFKEQKALMDEYEVEYKKSLEWLNTIRDMYSSLLIAIAFIFVMALMMPFFIDMDMSVLLLLTFIFLMLADGCIILIIKSVLPITPIYHSLKIKDPEYVKSREKLKTVAPISIILLAALSLLGWFANPLNITIALTPLIYIGFLARKRENEILRRDNEFPGFMRSLGGSLSAKGGSLLTTIETLRIHDFGSLNSNIELMYRRLKLGTDTAVCWVYFAGESGSLLINDFCNIFVDVNHLGGDPNKACQIISDNFTRVLNLRRVRRQLAGSLKGVFYGAVLALAVTVTAGIQAIVYVSATMTTMMETLAQTEQAKNVVQNLISSPNFDFAFTKQILFIILLLQTLFTAHLLKMIDGGDRLAALTEFVIIAWLLVMIQFLAEYATSIVVI
jgi:archaeal flagellar protein FlaJ